MINIKGFEDGSRYVIVLEGIEKPKAEGIVKDLLSSLLSAQEAEYTEVAKSDAEPVPETPQPEVSIIDRFEDGPYAGLKPIELISGTNDEKDAAFSYLCDVKDNVALGKEIEKARCFYMVDKLSGVEDPHAYAGKLNLKQMNLFLAKFAPAIPDAVKISTVTELLGVGGVFEDLNNAPEDTLRKSVEALIIRCREYVKN